MAQDADDSDNNQDFNQGKAFLLFKHDKSNST